MIYGKEESLYSRTRVREERERVLIGVNMENEIVVLAEKLQVAANLIVKLQDSLLYYGKSEENDRQALEVARKTYANLVAEITTTVGRLAKSSI